MAPAPYGEGGSLVCGNPAPGHLHSFPPLSRFFPWPSLQASLYPMLSHLMTPCLAVVVFIDVSECRDPGPVGTKPRDSRRLFPSLRYPSDHTD